MTGIIILVILGAIVIAFIGIFNRFAHLRNEVKNAWAGIEVQLRRRHDLIPNLVETAKGYLKHEQTSDHLREEVVAREASVQLSMMERRVHWLSVIGSLTPMIGLLAWVSPTASTSPFLAVGSLA